MSKALINRNPNILGGTPVFMGTRVPVNILIDHLLGGYTLNYFLDQYPTVSREQAVQFFELVRETLVADDEPGVAPEEVGPGKEAGQLLELVQGR